MPHPFRDFAYRKCAAVCGERQSPRPHLRQGDYWQCIECGAKRPIRKRKRKAE